MSRKRDKNGRWLPGQSGNPAGRQKFSLLSIIKEKLQDLDDATKRQVAELMIDNYIAEAVEERDGTAIRDLIDRIDGKPKQTIIQENEQDAKWLEYLKGLDAEKSE